MDDTQLIDQAAEVGAFAKLVRELSAGARWEEVAPHAEWAWTELIAVNNGTPWSSVCDFIRDTWLLH